MCGIIAVVGNQPATPLLIDGLRRLEYRGYDSAGVATLVDGLIQRRRAEGKLASLAEKVANDPLPGTIGIGHTRWATHGAPNERNAHPHATEHVALVHNGIIENYKELRAELESHQMRFESDTDTETVAQLLTHYINQGMTPDTAMATALKRLHGAFSLAIIFKGHPHMIFGARRGTPLAVGYDTQSMYLASDAIALAPLTNQICYLSDGDWVKITADSATIFDSNDNVVDRPIRQSTVSSAMIGKGEFRHFMLKEIHEQPEVIGDTLNSFVHPSTNAMTLPTLPFEWRDVPRITISACGTAFYAGMVAKYWFEQIARLPVELDIASEFRYREAAMPTGGAFLSVSQSGETLDTLEALRYARRQGQHILSVVNVPESTMARESDAVLFTRAGPEIGVASTKAFTTQLVALSCLVLDAALARGTITADQQNTMAAQLRELPAKIAEILGHDNDIAKLAHDIAEARDVLYLGRGLAYPIALEGALKLKEISYIHAEGYAAGEMKHGPIALIDENVPVIVVAPPDALFEKTASNIMEVNARGGQVMAISDASGIAQIGSIARWAITVPSCADFISPILYAVPVQLLAYHVAVLKGTDVDQPRNLAKSVTVE